MRNSPTNTNLSMRRRNCQLSIVNCQFVTAVISFLLMHTLYGQEGCPVAQKLTLEDRNRLTMNAVTEVVSFEESTVVLQTELGTLVVQGRELKLKTLSLEGGQVAVDGEITALVYEEPRVRRGWWGRLQG